VQRHGPRRGSLTKRRPCDVRRSSLQCRDRRFHARRSPPPGEPVQKLKRRECDDGSRPIGKHAPQPLRDPLFRDQKTGHAAHEPPYEPLINSKVAGEVPLAGRSLPGWPAGGHIGRQPAGGGIAIPGWNQPHRFHHIQLGVGIGVGPEGMDRDDMFAGHCSIASPEGGPFIPAARLQGSHRRPSLLFPRNTHVR
jgi:hypothetical protein